MVKLWPAYGLLSDVWRQKIDEINDAALSYLDALDAGADPAELLRDHQWIPLESDTDSKAFADFINSEEFDLD